ncbi:MAG: ribokinase [Alphaproteobacteria bacterium]
MGKILVIGSNMHDLITYTSDIPKAGETLAAKNFKMGFGGKGANQAVAAAQLGGDVVMLTAVGDDDFGIKTIDNLKAYQIDTQFVRTISEQSSGIATIIVDKTSQNRILIVQGANMYLTQEDIDNVFSQNENLSFCILQLEIAIPMVYYAIQKAKSLNIPILLNPAPACTDLDMDIISQVDILVPNETELEILSQMPTTNIDEIRAAARSLLKRGIKEIIVTLGSKGALYLSKEQEELFAAPKVDAIDTTGAGDAFIGAFSAECSGGRPIGEAIRFATEYASVSTTSKGTQSSYKKRSEL